MKFHKVVWTSKFALFFITHSGSGWCSLPTVDKIMIAMILRMSDRNDIHNLQFHLKNFWCFHYVTLQSLQKNNYFAKMKTMLFWNIYAELFHSLKKHTKGNYLMYGTWPIISVIVILKSKCFDLKRTMTAM